MFRVLALMIAVNAVAFAQQEINPSNSKVAEIEELLTLMKADQIVHQLALDLFSTFYRDLLEAPPGGDPHLTPEMLQDVQEVKKQTSEFITDRLRFEKLKPAYVKIYDETFSAEEIAGILAFYKSPVGQAFVEKSPAVKLKTDAEVERIMADSNRDILKLADTWMEKMKQKYPGLAPK